MHLGTKALPSITELTPDERSRRTDELLTRASWTPDPEREDLLAEVVVLNVRVACAIAARYSNRGVALDDLEQAACEGLVKAVHRFEPSHGKDLLSYAVPTVRGEIQRYFRDSAWTLRPPRRLQDLQAQINRTSEQLSVQTGRVPTPQEVCDALDIDRAEYDDAVSSFGCMHPPSLDQPINDHSQITVAETLRDDTDLRDAAETWAQLAPALRCLGARDRHVLYLRFFEELTQQEIGDRFGVAQVQVSRWLTRILGELRRQLEHPAPGREERLTLPHTAHIPALAAG